jgi:hypothetical protein
MEQDACHDQEGEEEQPLDFGESSIDPKKFEEARHDVARSGGSVARGRTWRPAATNRAVS